MPQGNRSEGCVFSALRHRCSSEPYSRTVSSSRLAEGQRSQQRGRSILGIGSSIKEVSGKLRVSVTERAVDGKANRAIEKALAKYFDVPPSCVRIVTGLTSRDKVVEVLTSKE